MFLWFFKCQLNPIDLDQLEPGKCLMAGRFPWAVMASGKLELLHMLQGQQGSGQASRSMGLAHWRVLPHASRAGTTFPQHLSNPTTIILLQGGPSGNWIHGIYQCLIPWHLLLILPWIYLASKGCILGSYRSE